MNQDAERTTFFDWAREIETVAKEPFRGNKFEVELKDCIDDFCLRAGPRYFDNYIVTELGVEFCKRYSAETIKRSLEQGWHYEDPIKTLENMVKGTACEIAFYKWARDLGFDPELDMTLGRRDAYDFKINGHVIDVKGTKNWFVVDVPTGQVRHKGSEFYVIATHKEEWNEKEHKESYKKLKEIKVSLLGFAEQTEIINNCKVFGPPRRTYYAVRKEECWRNMHKLKEKLEEAKENEDGNDCQTQK